MSPAQLAATIHSLVNRVTSLEVLVKQLEERIAVLESKKTLSLPKKRDA